MAARNRNKNQLRRNRRAPDRGAQAVNTNRRQPYSASWRPPYLCLPHRKNRRMTLSLLPSPPLASRPRLPVHLNAHGRRRIRDPLAAASPPLAHHLYYEYETPRSAGAQKGVSPVPPPSLHPSAPSMSLTARCFGAPTAACTSSSPRRRRNTSAAGRKRTDTGEQAGQGGCSGCRSSTTIFRCRQHIGLDCEHPHSLRLPERRFPLCCDGPSLPSAPAMWPSSPAVFGALATGPQAVRVGGEKPLQLAGSVHTL